MRKFKKGPFIAWIIIIGLLTLLYLYNPGLFDIDFLQKLVAENFILVLVIYLLILSLIGLTFIPSTPFAIAGVFLFGPVNAIIINLIGILTSSFIVYNFAQYLGLDQAFEEKYPGKIKKIEKALEWKVFPIIIAWSFFPIVPTDLIIYVASTLRIKLWKCLTGVLIGEGILNTIYIFSFASFI